jgi:hypothetical protein
MVPTRPKLGAIFPKWWCGKCNVLLEGLQADLIVLSVQNLIIDFWRASDF